MTNKFSKDPDEEDAKAILQNFSIKRYISNFAVREHELLYCIQVIRPENLRQLSRGDVNGELGENNLVVCLNEIKMGVLAKAVVYPGTNTFLMNLITSFSDDALIEDDLIRSDVLLEGSDKNAPSAGSSGKGLTSWIMEYQRGCDWEIYTTELSEIFTGAKFCELSLALYEKLGVVLFALQITDTIKTSNTKLLLNPSNYVIPPREHYKIEAFVIAKNKYDSDLTFAKRKLAPTADGDGAQSKANSWANAFKSPQLPETLRDRRKSLAVLSSGVDKIRSTFSMNMKPAKEMDADDEREEGTKKPSRWKALKRSALLAKKVQSNSFQEIYQRLEDEHFHKNYYLRANPVELADITIKTSVIEEVPYINNHDIIIGKELSNLYDLIRPLRAKYLGQLRYLVILCPTDIPYDVWQRISVFDCILVVRGSPLEESNLKRAGIFRATQVIVLADGTSSSTKSGMEALVDSDAIFAYQCVKRMNPNAQIVVEIVNQSNIAYLDTDISSLYNDYNHSITGATIRRVCISAY